jgi:phenylpyruvate tautomerase PptA (4-oxalocrotonate tautomerase family)
MPFVRIDLSNKHPEGFSQQVGDIVYAAMRQTINVPENDKFQVITRHEGNELVAPANYLGIDYSGEIIFIQVTLNTGRTTEMKKAFYKEICDGLVEKLKVRPQDIVINLVEVDKENWSFGNGEMQYGPKD